MSGITANRYRYHQTVAGLNSDYRYSGISSNIDFRVSRVLHRNGSQKTTLTYDVLARESKNYINDTEVEVQRRYTAAWRIGLQHRHYIAQATLDAGISYQRGTRWFGALPAPEENFGDATALSKIIRISSQLDLPFTLAKQKLRYNLQYQRQFSTTPLTPQDQFAIGNRWTVRGFDGERSLNADRGWFVRNEIAWATPVPLQELYLGVDYGETGAMARKIWWVTIWPGAPSVSAARHLTPVMTCLPPCRSPNLKVSKPARYRSVLTLTGSTKRQR